MHSMYISKIHHPMAEMPDKKLIEAPFFSAFEDTSRSNSLKANRYYLVTRSPFMDEVNLLHTYVYEGLRLSLSLPSQPLLFLDSFGGPFIK